jgi:hypothetical protein
VGRVGASATAHSGVRTKRRTRRRCQRLLGGAVAPRAAATRRPWRCLRLRPLWSPPRSVAPPPSSWPREGWLLWPPPTLRHPRPRPLSLASPGLPWRQRPPSSVPRWRSGLPHRASPEGASAAPLVRPLERHANPSIRLCSGSPTSRRMGTPPPWCTY